MALHQLSLQGRTNSGIGFGLPRQTVGIDGGVTLSGLGWFSTRVRLPQMDKGHRSPFDPPVIPTDRRFKTSACLRFYEVFSRGCTT